MRAVASLSPALRASLGEATSVLMRRGSRQRELYACGLRALSEAQDRQVLALLRQALAGDEAGGPAALSAACFSRDPELSPLLAKVAASRQSHLAFGAELARVARGESNGALLAQLAPMIKESHRISMCVELFVPLVRAPRRGSRRAGARGAPRGRAAPGPMARAGRGRREGRRHDAARGGEVASRFRTLKLARLDGIGFGRSALKRTPWRAPASRPEPSTTLISQVGFVCLMTTQDASNSHP